MNREFSLFHIFYIIPIIICAILLVYLLPNTISLPDVSESPKKSVNLMSSPADIKPLPSKDVFVVGKNESGYLILPSDYTLPSDDEEYRGTKLSDYGKMLSEKSDNDYILASNKENKSVIILFSLKNSNLFITRSTLINGLRDQCAEDFNIYRDKAIDEYTYQISGMYPDGQRESFYLLQNPSNSKQWYLLFVVSCEEEAPFDVKENFSTLYPADLIEE